MFNSMRLLKTALTLFFAGTFFFALPNASAADGSGGDDELVQARQAYNAGRYNETVKLANLRLRAEAVSALDRVEAYRLQGLAYSAQGKNKKARQAVTELVVIYPQYEPNAADPQAFNAIVLEAQEQRAQGTLTRKNGRVKQYVYTAVGVAMTAVVLGLSAQDW